jgi:hypothetical protein
MTRQPTKTVLDASSLPFGSIVAHGCRVWVAEDHDGQRWALTGLGRALGDADVDQALAAGAVVVRYGFGDAPEVTP